MLYFSLFQKTIIDKRLDEPYSLCTKMNATYRKDNCIELCLIQLTNNKYNCSLKSYYDLKYLKTCRDDSDFSNDLAGCEQECP